MQHVVESVELFKKKKLPVDGTPEPKHVAILHLSLFYLVHLLVDVWSTNGCKANGRKKVFQTVTEIRHCIH